jgi:tetratricopeptide (TPR) repeat protein
MPIRISRGLAVASLWFLAACAPTASVQAPETDPATTAEALIASAEAALQQGRLPDAARAYREAAQRSEDEQVAEQATRMAFDHHQLREAALAAERWLALNPTSENAHRYAGIAALRLHRLEEAERQFASLLETAYISAGAGFLALPPVMGDEGVPTDVMELFRRLSARYPDVAEGYYALGSSALRADNYAAAQAAAASAVAKAPYWKPAQMLHARTTIATGREEEGLAAARDLVTAPDSDIGTHLEYAMLLAATGRDEEARALLTPYASGDTVIPGAVRALGAIELDAGNLEAASRLFEDLLSTGAQSYEALYFLGLIAERRNDTDRALRQYSRVTAGDHVLAAQQRVARIKANQSGVQAGLAHLDALARSQPQLAPDVYASKAALLSLNGDDRQAGQVLDDAVARFPDVLDLRMSRIFFYERVGKDEAAIRELRALLADRPGDSSVQNALGYTLADNDRDLPEARRLLTAALAQAPDNAATLDSMGWLLYREGRFAEALQFLERASQLGADPEIDLHLGEVHWAMGNTDAARKTWAAGLERAPDNEKLRKRLERAGR